MEYRHTETKKFPRTQKRLTPENRHWNLFKQTHAVEFTGIISRLDFSHDSPFEIAVANGVQTNIYTCVEGFPQRKLEKLKDLITCVAFRKDGKLVLQGGADKMVHLVTKEKRIKLKRFRGHTRTVRDVAFGPNQSVLSCGDDGFWRIWDITSESQKTCFRGHQDSVRTCGFMQDNDNLFFTGGYDHVLSLWDTRQDPSQVVKKWKFNHHINRAICIHDHLAVANGPQIHFCSLQSDEPLADLSVHRKGVMSLSKTKDESRLITSGLDHFVKFVDTQSFEVVHQINFREPIMDAQISPNSRHLAVGFSSGKFAVWSMKGELLNAGAIEKAKERESEIETFFKNMRRAAMAPPKNPRPGTTRWFNRGSKHKASEKDLALPAAKRRKVSKQDRALRRFHYAEALDISLESVNGVQTVSLLEELWLRDGLEQALSGRDDAQLEPILRFLIKHINDPRLNTVCIHVMDLVVDMYGSSYGTSPNILDPLWKKINAKLNKEVEHRDKILKLQGFLEYLITQKTLRGKKN